MRVADKIDILLAYELNGETGAKNAEEYMNFVREKGLFPVRVPLFSSGSRSSFTQSEMAYEIIKVLYKFPSSSSIILVSIKLFSSPLRYLNLEKQ